MKISQLVVIPLSLILTSLAVAVMGVQGRLSPTGLESFNQDMPTGCEYNIAVLDVLAQKTEADDLIIVIAHLGDNETRPSLNRRRLHNVRTYLTEYLTDPGVRRKPETIIVADGERVKGYGRLEFYVKGKLVNTLRIRRNADLSVGNCGREPPEKPCPPEEKNLYPCRDRYLKRQ